MSIDNFSADQIEKRVHDIYTGECEILFKQMQPSSISVQSLKTVQIMCLNYSAKDPPNSKAVNNSEMLVSQNLPGG